MKSRQHMRLFALISTKAAFLIAVSSSWPVSFSDVPSQVDAVASRNLCAARQRPSVKCVGSHVIKGQALPTGSSHVKSAIPEALRIARKTRDALIAQSAATSSALRACRTISSLLKREKQHEWIELELNGYHHKFRKWRAAEKGLPAYRKARCYYFDIWNRPIQLDPKLSFLSSCLIMLPIDNLEQNLKEKTDGLYMHAGPQIDAARKLLRQASLQAMIPQSKIREIVNSVDNRMLDLLNGIILELDYAQIPHAIFEQTRATVDKQLARISPSALKDLVTTYRGLSTLSTPLEYSKVAFACREILMDFTDAIFKMEYLAKGEQPPRREQTKNKVRYVLRAKLRGKKDRELEMLTGLVDYLEAYFAKLTSYIQKQTHRKGFKATPEDANMCVMYTYLVIGDIIRLIR